MAVPPNVNDLLLRAFRRVGAMFVAESIVVLPVFRYVEDHASLSCNRKNFPDFI